MTDGTKLFGEDNTSQEQQNQEAVDNYMDLYVGEGKKYASVDDAMKALHHAQTYIPQLENENKGVREELNARQALQELVDKIQSSQAEHMEASNHQEQHDDERTSGNEATPHGLSREEIAQLVKESLNTEKQQSTFNQNIDNCASELEKAWGPGYRGVMSTKAKELGMSEQDLLDLAGKSPKAFLTTVGLTSNSASSNNGATSAPRNSFAPQRGVSGDRDWGYYQKMLRDDPVNYWSKNTQNEIFRRVKEGTLVPR